MLEPLRRSAFALVLAAVALAAIPARSQPGEDAAEKRPVVVASKDFTENRLLGEIIAQLIENRTDIPVERKLNLGSSSVVYEALVNTGGVDIYPEYTGTAWEQYLKIEDRAADPLQTYAVVSRRMAAEMNVRWMMPFGFENSFALAMPEAKAEELGITTISDLKAHEANLVARVSTDFFQRQDGWKPLVQDYGLNVPDVTSMQHSLTYQAAADGQADLIDVWTTDGKLRRLDLRILEDDQQFFPPYHCAPVVRKDALARYPELPGLLNELGFTLDNEAMQELNRRVEEIGDDGTGESFAEVAYSFLVDHELIDAAGGPPQGTVGRVSSFPAFMSARAVPTLRLAGEHLALTGIAVLLAILAAVPAGVLLARRPRLAGTVLGAAGVVQTIPSLALLVFMIPLFGLGAEAAIAALFLYALLPILRNSYTGIREVDADLIEAAKGIGLTGRQTLTKVELPLAIRTIMAGVRTSAVISVGVATLAAFIGAGGLGEPIVTGLQLNDMNWILSGAIPAAAMAVLVDASLGWVERMLQSGGVKS